MDKQTIVLISMIAIVLIIAGIYIYLRKKTKGKLKKRKPKTLGKKILYYTPRVLAILFTILVSLLALDVFSEYTGLELIGALLIHLFPTYILILVVLIAWKWEHIGGTIFIILGLLFILMIGPEKDLSFLIIPGILISIGVLFLLNKYF